MSATLVNGEQWLQAGDLALALALSALIGAERDLHHKAAGIRAYTLVGVGSALIMLVSKYGFNDVVTTNLIVLDPSIAAGQIVSGIGFLGGAIIFVQRNAVQGITTAAAIWLTTGIGMAAGGNLPILALLGATAYLIATFGLSPVGRWIRDNDEQTTALRMRYLDGQGVLRIAIEHCTRRGFALQAVSNHPLATMAGESGRQVELAMVVVGKRSITELTSELSGIKGITSVTAEDLPAEWEEP